MKTIIGHVWHHSCIGIVIVKNEMDELRAYIGTTNAGMDAETDLLKIAQYGSKFDLECAEKLIDKHGTKCKIQFDEEGIFSDDSESRRILPAAPAGFTMVITKNEFVAEGRAMLVCNPKDYARIAEMYKVTEPETKANEN